MVCSYVYHLPPYQMSCGSLLTDRKQKPKEISNINIAAALYSKKVSISFKDMLLFVIQNPNLNVPPSHKFAGPLCSCY